MEEGVEKRPCAANSARARRRPSTAVVSAITTAVGLFLASLSCCTTRAGALLQLDQVPNRVANKRSATFTYVCTPLDVADGDSCDVKVSELH